MAEESAKKVVAEWAWRVVNLVLSLIIIPSFVWVWQANEDMAVERSKVTAVEEDLVEVKADFKELEDDVESLEEDMEAVAVMKNDISYIRAAVDALNRAQ